VAALNAVKLAQACNAPGVALWAQADDLLPEGLVSLQVPDCPVAKPLLHLTNLATLNM
jgi:hypothetical protein